MFFSTSASLALALGAQQALAHIQLSTPFGINSKFDPQTPEGDIDYSGTTPLAADGSNYPCKGYNTPEKIASINSVATLKAGANFHVALSGSATHEGGSCQMSISYDEGKTFAVMASIIGGCPLDLEYDFTVPALPSKKKAIFAWTWNNKVGNREEYMDCAVVDVEGSTKAIELPSVFRANTLGDECVVPEGTEVVYPNPGKQVLGTIGAGGSPTTLNPCSFNEDSTVTLNGDGSSSSGGSTGGSDGGDGQGAGTGGGSEGAGQGGNDGGVTSTPPAAPTTTASPTSSAPIETPTGAAGSGSGGVAVGGGSGTGGASGAFIKCTGKDTWSLCDSSSGTCTPMGAVAPGTYCDDQSSSMMAIAVGKKQKMAKKVRRGHRAIKGRKAHA